MRGGQRLALVGSLGVQTLGAFGRQVQSPSLWRPSSQSITGPGIGSESAYRLVPTPHTFLEAAPPSTLQPRPPSIREVIHPYAEVLAQVAGVLDPASPGPLSPYGTEAGIGLESAYATILHRIAPELVTSADVLVLATEAVAWAYDRLYQAVYGSQS